jgi:glycosyltransferase involved in cell wall biosynthesis
MVKKKRLVISAVNCTEGGILSVMQDCVSSVCRDYGDLWDIYVLANNRSLVGTTVANVLEFPLAKKSWTGRLKHEWLHFRRLSIQLDPDVWLSLHDMSPNVRARRRVVYCHNALPFYSMRLRDIVLDWKFSLFCVFYGWLYAININSNEFVIVQQDWIRKEFRNRYKVKTVIVAHPEGIGWNPVGVGLRSATSGQQITRFCYPCFPRVFKNVEVICKAARILYESGDSSFEVVLTVEGTENAYARGVFKLYSDIPNLRFVGKLSREDVFELYQQSDCLIFPSKLETWGLPITEFKATNRPILVADLHYAEETVGSYAKVGYFDPDDAKKLAELMLGVMIGNPGAVRPQIARNIEMPYASSWSELWKLILI